jgi:hypothetical protein
MIHSCYSPSEPIELHRVIEVAPSIATEDSHGEHALVPTTRVLKSLIDEGFRIHGAMQTRFAEFTKHLIRLRKAGIEHKLVNSDLKVWDQTPEIVLISSPVGSMRYHLMAGLLRHTCTNGLIAGDMWGCVKINKHSSDIIGDVIRGTYKVVSQFDNLASAVDRMGYINLNLDEQEIFVRTALSLRFGDSPYPPVTADQVLQPRRNADAGDDVWRIFNRVQENLTKGGLLGQRRDANGRIQRQRIREVAGIDDNVRLNRALWTLAERTAEQKLMSQLKSQLKGLMSCHTVEHKVEHKVKTKALMDID